MGFAKGHVSKPVIKKPKVMRWKPISKGGNEIDLLKTISYVPGIKYLQKHLSGVILSRKQAMDAKCADCMEYYIDGKNDCELVNCPMYPYMPYRKKIT